MTTKPAQLRRLLEEVMQAASSSAGVPPICERIRDKREELQQRWQADHPGQRGNPYTQENVAHAIGVTRDAYRKFETVREPSLERLRQIATAFGLDEDWFQPTGNLTEATVRVEAEADRLAAMNDQLQEMLVGLRALLRETQGE
jgi:transcriptional regulator with XRE-family HTH domain